MGAVASQFSYNQKYKMARRLIKAAVLGCLLFLLDWKRELRQDCFTDHLFMPSKIYREDGFSQTRRKSTLI